MQIPLKVSKKDYFRMVLTLLNPILKLTDREIQLVAILVALQYNNRNLDEEVLSTMMFSTKVRKLICERLGMTDANLSTHMNSLRKKGVILKENKLSPALRKAFPEKKDGIVINYTVTVNDGDFV
jgi:DNA-binding MarR family transcriptional regulator